jgi:dimethylargininase
MADCLRRSDVSIDARRAALEHEGYVAALRDAGIEVVVLAEVEAEPDATFVEDTAVLLGDVALLTRPGAHSRRAEVASVGDALATSFSIETMTSPATLDGGDVLRIGDRLLVGLSSRTNAAGAARLEKIAMRVGLRVSTVTVDAGLHLKSVCTALDARTILHDAAAIEAERLRPFATRLWPVPEPAGANVLPLGDRVLCSADAPGTAARLRGAGYTVVTVALSTMHAADGALTCLSLREAPAGGWSA